MLFTPTTILTQAETVTVNEVVAVRPTSSVTVRVIVIEPVCPATGVKFSDATPEMLGWVILIFAFGNNVVFDEVADMTNALSADSASVTVIDTGPLLAPAQAVEMFAGVEIVGAAFTVVLSVGVVVVVLEEPLNEQTPSSLPVCGSTNCKVYEPEFGKLTP